jgi:hypothetical protein
VGCGTGEMVKWFSQQGAHAIGVPFRHRADTG